MYPALFLGTFALVVFLLLIISTVVEWLDIALFGSDGQATLVACITLGFLFATAMTGLTYYNEKKYEVKSSIIYDGVKYEKNSADTAQKSK